MHDNLQSNDNNKMIKTIFSTGNLIQQRTSTKQQHNIYVVCYANPHVATGGLSTIANSSFDAREDVAYSSYTEVYFYPVCMPKG